MTIITKTVVEGLWDFNEAEIRVHILDPVIRRLGYLDGDDVYFKPEKKLEYPYYHIGHRSKKDLPLGYPDYRAGLKGGKGSFIMEAKAANVEITQQDVEQAHSYAAHAQVGAKFFLLCDGTKLAIYETLSGPECPPITEIPVVDIDTRFHEIENVLSPARLRKYSHVEYDMKLKLCDGLGSSVGISSGLYDMDEWVVRFFLNGEDCTETARAMLPQLAVAEAQIEMMKNDFILKVAHGYAERDEQGLINARVKFDGATKGSMEGMKLLNIEEMAFATDSEFLSKDAENPTVFESTAEFSVPQGTMMPSLLGAPALMESQVDGDLFITARMHVEGAEIVGEYAAVTDYWSEIAGLGSLKIEFDIVGGFKLQLAV